MTLYVRIIDKLNEGIKKVLGVLLAVMCLIIIIQVVFRGFKMSLPWSEEFSRYLMIYIVFLGSGYAVRYDLLMSVKILWGKIPAASVRCLSFLVNGLMGIFFLMIFVYGLILLGTVKSQTSPAMQLPMSLPYGAIVAGSALMLLNCTAVIVEDATVKKKERRGP